MRTILLLLTAGWPLLCWGQQDYRLCKVADIQSGMVGFGSVICGDTDRDSLPDLNFWIGLPWQWQFWEWSAPGHYVLVRADTCVGDPYPDSGIHKGRFLPTDLNDVDEDGLQEVLGFNTWYFIDSVHELACLYEQPPGLQPDSYPDTLVWYYSYGNAGAGAWSWLPGDMDRDGRKEIVASDGWYTYVFENRGDNRFDLVFRTPLQHYTYDCTFGDFDQDSACEFVLTPVGSDYVYIYECTGDDQYALVDSFLHSYPNAPDLFAGKDVDRDGKPEFFIVYARYDGEDHDYYLVMYEATGNNSYEGTVIDSVIGTGGMFHGAHQSTCADIDGDGVEEVLMSWQAGFNVYRATGNNQFQKVWFWRNPFPDPKSTFVTAYDMNRNGYQDIVVSGNGHTWMFEMEAVRVVSPNGGERLEPGQVSIVRWRVYNPPWCDSVSLFLMTDTTIYPPHPYPLPDGGRGERRGGDGFWRLDTIATGLPPSDSIYAWVVPDTTLPWPKIVAIAYGPGWQFDESDSAFSIVPSGVTEQQPASIRDWALAVSPNPVRGNAVVRYDVPRQAFVTVGLYDVTGRLAYPLAAGIVQAGRYEVALGPRTGLTAGVYYLRLETPAKRLSKKVVLAQR